mmetsp:Transcript_48849/g.121202  ORF Transcript_48849/g.121202 Transcript_48849/m.121202 type:complete len:201 (+) Transcript_48849:1614-2216(+)
MPPRASLIFLAVLMEVWLTYPATRSPFCTSTTVSLLATPSCLYSRATSRETVVLPTPGLPVNIMCRMESRTLRPSCRRLMSRESCLHSLRMLALTDSIPTSLASSSSISFSAFCSCSSVSGSGSSPSSDSSFISSASPPPFAFFNPGFLLASIPFFSVSARAVYSMHFSRMVFWVIGFFSYLRAVIRYSAALQYLFIASS